MDSVLGLTAEDLEKIISVLHSKEEVAEAILFGSRAKGNYKPGSDVDIALKGKELNLEIVTNISFLLNEETIMPYKFDVLNYHSIQNADLTEHIDRIGVCIYKRG